MHRRVAVSLSNYSRATLLPLFAHASITFALNFNEKEHRPSTLCRHPQLLSSSRRFFTKILALAVAAAKQKEGFH